MSEVPGALCTLAEQVGISTRWTNADGREAEVSAEALREIVTAMGFACDSTAQCRQSLERLADERRELAVPPLLTGWCQESVVIDAASGLHGQPFEIDIDGHVHAGVFPSDRNQPLSLPPIAVPGYHSLTVQGRTVTLAIAPTRCFGLDDISVGAQSAHKPWGLGVQLYALRRQGDAGIGDFTALRMLAEGLGRRGAAALAISPVHAMPSAGIRHFSPYSPSSREFLSALHIDPAAVLDEARFKAVVEEDGCHAAVRRELETAQSIDWDSASRWRMEMLRKLFDRFCEHGDQAAFADFRRQRGEALEDHARFETLRACYTMQGMEAFWPRWPTQYRHPRSPEVAAFAHQHVSEVAFHAFLQWQAERGLEAAQQAARAAGMPVGLVADLAVGSDRGGSQAWSRQEEMLNALSIGAPPDHFNPQGQNWELVTLCPHAMRRNGFKAWLEMLRANLRHAGGIRIDHIMGLARLWVMPPGGLAGDGAYLRYPMDDLLRLLVLESHRHRAIVIGENLGTLPQGFNDRIASAGILGMQVLWLSRKGEEFLPPAEWRSDSIGMTTTHDLPTVAGWWKGCDIEWKSRLDMLGENTDQASEAQRREHERRLLTRALHAFQAEGKCNGSGGDNLAPSAASVPLDELIAFVGATPAPLVIVPLEDALAETEQPNLPGTVDVHPNWQRRMPLSLEHLFDAPAVSGRIAALAEARRDTAT